MTFNNFAYSLTLYWLIYLFAQKYAISLIFLIFFNYLFKETQTLHNRQHLNFYLYFYLPFQWISTIYQNLFKETSVKSVNCL